MLDFSVAPGAGPEPHIHHTHDEAFYVIDGQMSVQLGSEVVIADAGTFVLVPKGTIHAHSNPGQQPNRVIALFSPGTMDGFIAPLMELRRAGYSEDSPEIESLRQRFDTESVDTPRLF
jgi:quercetin dioxygenase-like cupin family protein